MGVHVPAASLKSLLLDADAGGAAAVMLHCAAALAAANLAGMLEGTPYWY
jgi:hypothetical protein